MYRPAGGTFMVEFSGNRAFTSLSYNGTLAKGFGEGEDEPGYGQNGPWSVAQLLVCWRRTDCLFIASARRTYMQSTNLVFTYSLLCVQEPPLTIPPDASGYAFAISYQSDISKVTLENLVVFTTKYKYVFIPFFQNSC